MNRGRKMPPPLPQLNVVYALSQKAWKYIIRKTLRKGRVKVKPRGGGG